MVFAHTPKPIFGDTPKEIHHIIVFRDLPKLFGYTPKPVRRYTKNCFW